MSTMAERITARGSNPAYQAYQILHFGFALGALALTRLAEAVETA